MYNTEDIKQQLIVKYKAGDFRVTKTGVKTVELQNVQFECDKDYIIREPNYDYASREIEWYESQSLNVNDIPGKTPAIWEQCADVNGEINSNYGWMIWSKENGSQYQNCLWQLINDPVTREATMIYNRPSMHVDATANHKHDFCCTYAVQCFLNPINIEKTKENTYDLPCYALNYIVYMRSNDAIFGFDNDVLWHMHVQKKLCADLSAALNAAVFPQKIIWHAGSLHVYERHFKYLEE